MTEERDLLDAQNLRGGELLGLAGRGKLLRSGAAVIGPLVAAGGEHVLRAVAAPDEARDCSRADELGVIRVGEDRHDAGSGIVAERMLRVGHAGIILHRGSFGDVIADGRRRGCLACARLPRLSLPAYQQAR
jgi:hypothetical protein